MLEPEQIALVLKEAEKDDYHNLFLVAMFTGMRQGELLGLAWEAVDFKTGCITVTGQSWSLDSGVYAQPVCACQPENADAEFKADERLFYQADAGTHGIAESRQLFGYSFWVPFGYFW